jgi:KaiC/GvpD/RAD55 family RecA-like ATPase
MAKAVGQEGSNSMNSNEKLELLLKKLAMLEDMVLIGNKVYPKEQKLRTANAFLEGKVEVEKHEVSAGESFVLEIDIANSGQASALLDGIEEIVPCCGLELTSSPSKYDLEGSILDLNGQVLEPSRIEKLRFTMRALEKGTYAIAPRIIYTDGLGPQRIMDLKPAIVNVKEVVLPGRIGVGYKDLDNLLFGGIPEKYAVMLTSVSCDETMLIIDRFLEKGAREGEITLLVTVDASRWERLAEEFPNFHLFVCNPQAETATRSLSNIIKLRGVESLTDISILLFSALRKFEATDVKPRRICIEILSDILLQHRAVQTRRWLVGLITELKSKGFTTLAVMNPHMHSPEETQAVVDLFDGEIEVYEKESKRFLRIKKMYGQNYVSDELPLNKDRLTTMGTSKRWNYQNY